MYLVTHMAEICMYLQARKYFELSYNFKPLISYFFKLFSPHLLPDKSDGKFLLSLSKQDLIDNTFYSFTQALKVGVGSVPNRRQSS